MALRKLTLRRQQPVKFIADREISGTSSKSLPTAGNHFARKRRKGGAMKDTRLSQLTVCASAGVMLMGSLGAAGAATTAPQAGPDRTILPIQEPKWPLYSELDVRNATMPPHFEVKAPAGAPNVVIVLIDDLGFGATGTYGGPIPTPTLERLARTACGTTISTPPRCPRRPVPRSSPAATTTPSTWASSPRWRPASRAPPARSPTPRPRWRRCCASTATARAPSASGTRPPPGRPASPVPSTAGRPAGLRQVLRLSSAAKPTSGRPTSMTA